MKRSKARGRIIATWEKEDRHTGQCRTITCRESDLVRMNQWLRDMEIAAVPRDAERRAKDNNHHRSAA